MSGRRGTVQLRYRKSAGVRVTAPVHRLIAAGNRARAERRWADAARSYAAALEADPALAHIWVQLGHARKELGDLTGAGEAYDAALRLTPHDADLHVQMGHLAKVGGDLTNAGRRYQEALRHAPGDAQALAELVAVVASGQDTDRASLTALLREAAGEPPVAAMPRLTTAPTSRDGAAAAPDAALAVVFDVSDLIAYFRDSRSPSGIQRVQIETITRAFAAAAEVRVCAFSEGRNEWVELPAPLFAELCAASLDGSEEAWQRARARTLLELVVGAEVTFRAGAFLVNLGTSWWLPNYFMAVREAKRRFGIRYVPFVHDMIPIVRGDLCPPLLVQEFIGWAAAVFEHADCFFVNSRSTKADMLRVADFLGHRVAEEAVMVVPLDADMRKGRAPASRGFVRRHGLANLPYVLLVSTIEPRKNHLRAFDAWARLIQRHGARRVPRLVCVGQRGWMNAPIHARLDGDAALAQHVTLLSGIADGELAELYAHCLFTLYPSQYEGWGLPITEALCHGKAVVAADNSSLREAGGPFARYFDTESTAALVEALEPLMFEAGVRRAAETRIAQGFAPRPWDEVAGQMVAALGSWRDRPASSLPDAPLATLGRWHPLQRPQTGRLWPGLRSTEGFRAGTGWWGRDDWGCWTRPGGGSVRFAVPGEAAALRVYVQLHGLPTARCGWRIVVAGEVRAYGDLRADERRWTGIDVAPAEVVELHIEGDATEDLRETLKTGDPRVISVGVTGFFVCRAIDQAARGALLEAVALGNVDELSVTREPLDAPRLA